MISRPDPTEYAPYYETYIKLVKENSVLEVLENGIFKMQSALSDIDEDKENYAYAPGKWTIRELVGHMIDTERIMTYRALSFARGEKEALPGYDENEYVKNSNSNSRKLVEMADEFSLLRGSSIALFKSFDESALSRRGVANKNGISVRALIYIVAGHQAHHMNVLRERYL